MLEDPFKKYDPQILEIVRNFRLLDDDFMTKVFEDKACLELMLQIIMDIPTLNVESFHIQDSLKIFKGVLYDLTFGRRMIHTRSITLRSNERTKVPA